MPVASCRFPVPSPQRPTPSVQNPRPPLRLPFSSFVLAAALFAGGCATARLPAPTGPTPSSTGDLGGPLRQAWRYDAEAGFGETPGVIVGDLLYVGTRSGEVHAIRLETGKKAASARLFDAIETAPLPVGDNRLFVVPKSRQRPVLLQLGGGTVWTARDRVAVVLPPELVHNEVHLVTHDGQAALIDIRTGERDGEWSPPSRLRSFAIGFGSVHMRPGEIRQGDGTWTFALADTLVRFTDPVEVQRSIVAGATDGVVRSLDAATGELRWMRDLGDPMVASPTFHNGHLYVGTLGRKLFVLDDETGAILHEYRVGGRIQSRPLVYPGGVVVYAEPSHVYHFVPVSDDSSAAR